MGSPGYSLHTEVDLLSGGHRVCNPLYEFGEAFRAAHLFSTQSVYLLSMASGGALTNSWLDRHLETVHRPYANSLGQGDWLPPGPGLTICIISPNAGSMPSRIKCRLVNLFSAFSMALVAPLTLPPTALMILSTTPLVVEEVSAWRGSGFRSRSDLLRSCEMGSSWCFSGGATNARSIS